MAKLTLHDCEAKAQRDRPWSFRLEYVGSNPNNASGLSAKYWYATGRGLNEQVETAWGKIGSAPHGSKLVNWDKLRDRVALKRADGYTYVDCPYVRMSAKSLAKLGGATASTPSTTRGSQATPAPAVAPPSAHPLGAPVHTPVPAPQTTAAPVQTPKPTGQVSADLLALGVPWSLVRSLKVIRDGTALTGYSAQDENGDELLKFDPTGGVDFAREYDLDIEWV